MSQAKPPTPWNGQRVRSYSAAPEQGIRSPAVVIVIDDLLNLLKRVPEIASAIGEIASMGGGCGIFQLLGTQDAGSKRGTGGMDVEANITARIVYRSSSASAAARATGQGSVGVDQLSGHKGDGLLIIDDRTRRIATAFMDDALLSKLPRGQVVTSPWLGGAGVVIGGADDDAQVVTGGSSRNQC